MLKKVLYILICFGVSVSTYGQSSNQVCKYIKVDGAPQRLDSLSVVPETIKFEGYSQIKFNYDINTGELIFNGGEDVDSVQVCYTTFPFDLTETYYNRSLALYDSNARFNSTIPNSHFHNLENQLIQLDNVTTSGIITRGVSFGNRQNVFVNSSLNLNLDGELTDGLNIRASISDQNIPFQPEGNTQQIQDFDNVFIELYNDRFSLIGGDIVLNNQPSNFSRYNKNVQGAKAGYQYQIGDRISALTSINVAQAKGTFASVIVEAQDGVSGPYKIPGPQNQRFVIVIANSEKVFVDGKLLERGYNYDYTIDYNLGEIIFTSNVLITQYSRIRIDYEMADQDYARTISSFDHSQQMGKWSFRFSNYTEKDNRNRSLTNLLSTNDKMTLSEIGDDVTAALSPALDSVQFSPSEVLYSKSAIVDNDGNVQEIFIHTNNPDSAHYRVRFMDVGLGQGSYILSEIVANGRIYQWVSPDGGLKQGQYEPVEILPLPNKRQMTAALVAVAISPYDSVYTEFAFSNHDLNLFSDINDDDNLGSAIKTGYVMNNRPVWFSKEYKLHADFGIEYDDKNFKPIDRYRSIEFDRNWSYTPDLDTGNVSDIIAGAELMLVRDLNNKISYRINSRGRETTLHGTQHEISWHQSLSEFQMRSDYFTMEVMKPGSRSNWKKLQTDISWNSKLFTPGYIYRFDKNVINSNSNDSIIGGALNYNEHMFYFTNRQDAEHTYRVGYSIREDNIPEEGKLVNSTDAQTLSVQSDAKIGTNQLLKTQLIYRKVNYLINQKYDENMMGRIDWHGQLLRDHMRPTVSYTLGTGRELKREYVYVEVPIGQGTHAWRDINSDGIRDLNEFFIAINPDEKQFVKMFVPTTEYINAYTSGLNMTVNANMPHEWKTNTGIRHVLSGLTNLTSWISDTKVTEGDFKNRFFSFATNSENLLSERSSLRSVLYYNSGSGVFGAEGGILKNKSQLLLTSGTDLTRSNQYHSIVRWYIQRIYTLKLGSNWGDKLVASDYMDDRNYYVTQKSLSPSLAWQPGNDFRLTGKYTHEENYGQFTEELMDEYSTILNTAAVELRYNRLSRGTFSVDVRYIDIEFDGQENSALGYELLNALRPGENITWNANFILKFTSGIQLQLNYEGRKSPGIDVVNIGRMQVSAMF